MHTAASKLPVTDTSLTSWVRFMTEESYPRRLRLWGRSRDGHSGGSNDETAFNIAFSTELPLLEWFGQHPEAMARFAEAMKANADSESYNVSHAAAGYNWKGLGWPCG